MGVKVCKYLRYIKKKGITYHILKVTLLVTTIHTHFLKCQKSLAFKVSGFEPSYSHFHNMGMRDMEL